MGTPQPAGLSVCTKMSQHLGGTPEQGSDAEGEEGKHMNCLA